VAVLALLVAGLVAVWNNSETVRAVVKGLWEGMKTAANVVSELVSSLLGLFARHWSQLPAKSVS